jgi:hypothetical protein
MKFRLALNIEGKSEIDLVYLHTNITLQNKYFIFVLFLYYSTLF